ncbi:MAG: sulfatase [Candidatus Eisenbacteria bacterium]|nr:sulfatase [Candidatus Eisenbacteria bacterium]
MMPRSCPLSRDRGLVTIGAFRARRRMVTAARSAMVLWAAAAALMGGCSERTGPPAVRPGDSVFDFLASGEITRLPDTNLPADIAGVAGTPFLLRSEELRADEWMAQGLPPIRLRPSIRDSTIRFWSARPAVDGRGRSTVIVNVQGRPHARWRPAHEPFPGWDVWWDEQVGTLYALAPTPPEGVSVTVAGDPSVEFAACEPRLAGTNLASAMRPGSLVQTVRLAGMSRRALLLPAPGCITLPLGTLGCEELRVTTGIIDRAYERIPEGLAQARGRSDGVRFAVEISTGGRWQRVWERFVGLSEGAWADVQSIDLNSYKGRKATLRLVTEPGPAHDPFFDYAVWGGLTFHGTPSVKPSRPHIVVIDLDTLRKDRLGCYGNPRGLTPRIDRWAQRATIFTDCIAAAPWTLPSTVSMFTGLSVHQHGVDQFPKAMTEAMAPLPLLLQRAGYRTMGLAEGGYVSADFGFSLGFDLYDCTRFKNPQWTEALGWLRHRRSERPVFLFLHTYMVHAPYPFDPRFEDPSSPYRTRLRGQPIDYAAVIEPQGRGALEVGSEDRRYIGDMYDAQVLRLDDYVGAFVDSLDEVLDGEPCAVFLTSDHGEELLDHGLLGHGQSLFQELLAVPLVVRFAGQSAPMVDGRPTSALDLAPTILDLAGLPVDGLPGCPLRALPHEARGRVASQSRSVHALVSEGMKLISGRVIGPRGLSAPVQLYDLVRDPGETVDLLPGGHGSMNSLAELLVDFLRSHAPLAEPAEPRPAWAGDLRRLEALGYVRHDSPAPGTVGATPQPAPRDQALIGQERPTPRALSPDR